MLKIKKCLLALTVIAVLPSAPTYTNAAYADAGNLACESPFKKIRTYPNAIKCKAAAGGNRSKQIATQTAASIALNNGCNGHSSPPKFRIWKKADRWAYRVTFICAVVY